MAALSPDEMLYNQFVNGEIRGSVTDSLTGEGIEGSTVTAVPGDYLVTTDENGGYTLSVPTTDLYTVTLIAEGYSSGLFESVSTKRDSTTTVDFILQAESGDIPTSVEATPVEFAVKAPYPNPFNPTTTLEYSIPSECHVKISVYNIIGKEVAILEDDIKGSGSYSRVWNARDKNGNKLGAGLYLYKITAGVHSEVGKMTLLK